MNLIKKAFVFSLAMMLSTILFVRLALSHCELPCGIYEDQRRMDEIKESIDTIELSMKQVSSLSKEDNKNFNQIVRWVQNKERHANKIRYITTQYFMTQRIKPAEVQDEKAYKEYINELTLLHQMLVYSMRAKQTIDLENVEELRSLLAQFQEAYLAYKKKY